MKTLRIEHRVSSFDGWRNAFDSDPINRKQSGVIKYRIYRPAENVNFVMIELDFENLEQAQSAKAALEKIFPNIDGKLIFDVQLTLLELVDETIL